MGAVTDLLLFGAVVLALAVAAVVLATLMRDEAEKSPQEREVER